MRKEPFTVGSYIHVVKRGTRGMPIVHDQADRWRFILMLRHFNDTFQPADWHQELRSEKIANTLTRPQIWPVQERLVSILCFCLLDNHFHLLLKETRENGVASFMQRLGTGMARYYNSKYGKQGSIFQGSYRSKTIGSSNYLQHASAYIQVKNAFERLPGGYDKAKNNFDKAFTWASESPYSSLGSYTGYTESPIIDKDILGEMFSTEEYKKFAKEFIEGRLVLEENVISFE